MRVRENRKCFRCSKDFKKLFRCIIDSSGNWIFICEFCLESSKKDNIFYQYGGTWKSKKKD